MPLGCMFRLQRDNNSFKYYKQQINGNNFLERFSKDLNAQVWTILDKQILKRLLQILV